MYLGLLTGGSPKCGYSHVGGNIITDPLTGVTLYDDRGK